MTFMLHFCCSDDFKVKSVKLLHYYDIDVFDLESHVHIV